jgi:hypothetical protein
MLFFERMKSMLKTGLMRICLPFVTVLLAAAAATPARCDTVLRWKLTPGETLRFVTQMKMVAKVGNGPAPFTTTSNQTVEMSWVVMSLDADGVASVTQTFDRLRLKMTSPQGVMVDFDSATNGETAGISKALVPFLESIVNKPISVKIDPRGEVSDVQVPQSMLDGMKKVPGMGSFFSGETLGKLSGLGTLPEEAISKNDVWTTEAGVDVPLFGKMKTQSKFRYLGSEIRDGRRLEKIGYTQQMVVTPATEQSGNTMKVTDQSVSGTTYFDNVAGRVAESDVTSKMKIEVTTAGMTMKTESETQALMKLVSVEASKKLR